MKCGRHYRLFLFVYINIAVQGVLGNAEIIGNFIPGLGDEESTGIIEKLDRSDLVLFIHSATGLPTRATDSSIR